MKRFVITQQIKGKYVIPVIKTLEFNSPKKLGSYCADNGSLWVTLDDGVNIFKDETLAKTQLNNLISELFGITIGE
jgi:hypothetical protein